VTGNHNCHKKALSTMRRSESYESASAFNIFDGTNASEEFAAYVFSDDDDGDDDDHCDIDDDIDENCEKDIDDHIEAVEPDNDDGTVKAPAQHHLSQVGYGPGEDERESMYWSTIQDHV
jgi:hypothetical protein